MPRSRTAVLALVALALAGPAAIAADPPAALYLDRPDPGPVASAWQADLVAGFPLAARVQRRVGDGPFWLEGGAGLFVIIPTAFVGARVEAAWDVTSRHNLAVRPGVDFYLLASPTFDQLVSYGGAGIGLDMDLIWRARWTDGLAGEFGFKLGMLFDPRGRVVPFPACGLIFGLRF